MANTGIQRKSYKETDWTKLLAAAPLRTLMRVARERNAEEKRENGRWASVKKLVVCPYGCGKNVGVREAKRHRQFGCPRSGLGLVRKRDAVKA